MKDIWLGFLGMLHAGYELTRDYLKTYWKGWRTVERKYRCVAYTLIVLALLLGSQCVAAYSTSDSNYGVWYDESAQGITYICFLPNGVAETGEIMTCLIGQEAMPGAHLIQGQVIYCAVTGAKEFDGQTRPFIECDELEALQQTIRGI